MKNILIKNIKSKITRKRRAVGERRKSKRIINVRKQNKRLPFKSKSTHGGAAAKTESKFTKDNFLNLFTPDTNPLQMKYRAQSPQISPKEDFYIKKNYYVNILEQIIETMKEIKEKMKNIYEYSIYGEKAIVMASSLIVSGESYVSSKWYLEKFFYKMGDLVINFDEYNSYNNNNNLHEYNNFCDRVFLILDPDNLKISFEKVPQEVRGDNDNDNGDKYVEQQCANLLSLFKKLKVFINEVPKLEQKSLT